MSDARVTFQTLDWATAGHGTEQEFSFRCPRNGRRCESLVIINRFVDKLRNLPQWSWDGDRSAPTFEPSINCGACGWHGFIERGRCVNIARQDEPEPAGERTPEDCKREFDALRADAIKNAGD